MLFKGEYISVNEIVNIKLIKSQNINYETRMLAQEEIKQICRKHFARYYKGRIEYLLGLYSARTDLGDVLFRNVDDYISDIVQELTNNQCSVVPTEANISKKTDKYNAFDCGLIEYFGDSPKSDKIINLIYSNIQKYIELLNKNISWFYQDNRELFVEIALQKLITLSGNTALKHYEIEEVITELKSLNILDSVIKLIYTFMFSSSALTAYKQIDFIDYTYISVSLFKLAELLFSELLKKYWGHKKIISQKENQKAKNNNRGPKQINLSNEKLVLGEKKQFLYSTDSEINLHLESKSQYKEMVNQKIGNWIDKDRNGFLHKDIQSAEELNNCIPATLELMFYLVLLIKK